jgi:hypothetical protein
MKIIKLVIAFAALFTVFGRRHRRSRRNRDQFEDDFNTFFQVNKETRSLADFKGFINKNPDKEVFVKCPNPNQAFLDRLKSHTDKSKTPLALFTELVNNDADRQTYCTVQPSGSGPAKRRRRKYFY